MNMEEKPMPQKLNYGLLLMPLMPDYNLHVFGMWKIVKGWTLRHTTYALKIFLCFSIILERIFKTNGSTNLHNSDYSKVCINGLTCFFFKSNMPLCARGKIKFSISK